MQITLTKTIKLYTSNMIAEVDFFKESPYIELFKKYRTKYDVKSFLEPKIGKAGVKNLLQRLDDLGCIQQGGEIDVLTGFPEREYGKYQLEYFHNKTEKPFVYKVKGIRREAPETQNIADRLEKNESLSKFLTAGEHEVVSSHKGEEKEIFSVLKVERSVFHEQKSQDVALKLQYRKKNWEYVLGNQKYPMESMFSLADVFERWDKDAEAQEWHFSDIQDDDYAVHHFKIKNTYNKVSVPEFGEFKLVAKDVPIIPDIKSVSEWFLFLFKEAFNEQDCFMTADDTEQLWLNLYDSIPPFHENYIIDFDFEEIKQSFYNKDKNYWHMMAAKDLNPFQLKNTKQSPKKLVVIQKQEGCDVEDVFKELPLQHAKQLLILDRYINSKRHFKALEKLQETFPNLSIAVVSMEDYKSQDSEFIQSILSKYDIKRLVKGKKNVPHDRHWKIDNHIYVCTKSMDFLTVDSEECSVSHVHFSRIEQDDMEKEAEKCFEELIKEINYANID